MNKETKNKVEELTKYILNHPLIKKYGAEQTIIVWTTHKEYVQIWVNLNNKARQNCFNKFIKTLESQFDLSMAIYSNNKKDGTINDYIIIQFEVKEE